MKKHRSVQRRWKLAFAGIVFCGVVVGLGTMVGSLWGATAYPDYGWLVFFALLGPAIIGALTCLLLDKLELLERCPRCGASLPATNFDDGWHQLHCGECHYNTYYLGGNPEA